MPHCRLLIARVGRTCRARSLGFFFLKWCPAGYRHYRVPAEPHWHAREVTRGFQLHGRLEGMVGNPRTRCARPSQVLVLTFRLTSFQDFVVEIRVAAASSIGGRCLSSSATRVPPISLDAALGPPGSRTAPRPLDAAVAAPSQVALAPLSMVRPPRTVAQPFALPPMIPIGVVGAVALPELLGHLSRSLPWVVVPAGNTHGHDYDFAARMAFDIGFKCELGVVFMNLARDLLHPIPLLLLTITMVAWLFLCMHLLLTIVRVSMLLTLLLQVPFSLIIALLLVVGLVSCWFAGGSDFYYLRVLDVGLQSATVSVCTCHPRCFDVVGCNHLRATS
ncbi:unnamed protein product [Prorocentrum cordatum]|uniref:Uncharacterized protein n=1 Tax=Prorocentrum cordatum TaxID=2364126 RepID=A0ABN9XPT6_9DINO|nr:unnamed protein product [Polarella glacialis]